MKIVKVAVAAALLASGVVHPAIYELTDVAYFYPGVFSQQPPPAGYLTCWISLMGPRRKLEGRRSTTDRAKRTIHLANTGLPRTFPSWWSERTSRMYRAIAACALLISACSTAPDVELERRKIASPER